MINRFCAEDEPAKTRVDYWQHVMSSTIAPYRIRTVAGSLRSRIRHAEIGPVTVLDLHASGMEVSRTPDLIRNSDLGMCKIDVAIGGRGVFEQDGRQSVTAPGEFIFIDLSRPSRVAIDRWHKGAIVLFPRALLPVRYNEMRELTAVRFSPTDPYAALVSSLVTELTRHLDAYAGDRDPRIGAAFIDLLSLAVATRLDRVPAVPAESRQNAMMLRIQAFIEQRLGDPGLSPGVIAAAHHISIRTLHKLYEATEETITASIRRQRLERSRQDLLNPGLRDRPVSAVGARWGFPDAAGFSRAFRAAYGLPPAEYRATRAGVLRARGGKRRLAVLSVADPGVRAVVARRRARHRPAIQPGWPHRPRAAWQQDHVPHDAVVVGQLRRAHRHDRGSPHCARAVVARVPIQGRTRLLSAGCAPISSRDAPPRGTCGRARRGARSG
jgi:AraC-like DNA-binding protein